MEPPAQYDTPPFVDPGDVDPISENMVVVNRSTATTKVLQVMRVSDYNIGDQIEYEFWALTSAQVPLRLARGMLAESPVQDNPKVTTYTEVSYQLDACAVELANEDWTVVWLRLIDDIPTDQQQLLGRSEYVVDIFWDIQLLEPNACLP